MPLYMDIHFLGDGFTLEDARKAHLRDMAVQEKYGVMYHQYWVNEEAGDEFPKNGWSLFGLWQSLKAQGKMTEARQVKAQFDEAWKHADIELTASVVR